MAQARRAFEKRNKQPINKFIKAAKVRLISQTGEQLGVVDLNEALDKAKDQDLDLVQMNNDTDTPVCKLMDYGKHLFDQKKQKAASKKKTKKTRKINKLNKIKKEISYEIPLFSQFKKFKESNYTVNFLKDICKHYKLVQRGNKHEVRDKIYDFLFNSYYAVKIQKNFRR